MRDEENFVALQFQLFHSQLVAPRIWFERFCSIGTENMVEHPVQPAFLMFASSILGMKSFRNASRNPDFFKKPTAGMTSGQVSA